MDENKRNEDGKRIALSTQLFEALEREVAAIKQKGSHLKVNESKLATAMIERFMDRYSTKDRKWIEDKFFDKRTYLKGLIDKSTSEDDLSSSVKEFLHMSRSNRPAKTTESES